MKVRHMKSVQKAESAAWNTLFRFHGLLRMPLCEVFCGHYYMNCKHSVMDMPRLVSYNQLVYCILLTRNRAGGEPVGESMGYSYGC